MLSRRSGAIVHRDGRLTVHQLDEEDFRTQVWRLIDANTLVVAVACRAQPRDFLDCWWVTSASPAALRLHQVGIPVPEEARQVPERQRMTHHTRRQLAVQLRVDQRQAEMLRQAVNEQHKACWLDGLDQPGDAAHTLLRQLEQAEQRVAEMRDRLVNRPTAPSLNNLWNKRW